MSILEELDRKCKLATRLMKQAGPDWDAETHYYFVAIKYRDFHTYTLNLQMDFEHRTSRPIGQNYAIKLDMVLPKDCKDG